jgi:transcriptional regulator with XRE-family HTH domain
MDFEELRIRLVAALKARLRNGELSERRMARLTGISQPHIHNVLKGVRILSPRAADQVLRSLRMTVLDLLRPEDSPAGLCPRCGGASRFAEVPVLDAWLGPGLPLPQEAVSLESHPFPRPFIASLEQPLVARLAPDALMGALFREGDMALLDRARSKRLLFESSGLYVVNREGEGLVRRLRRGGLRDLLLVAVSSDGREHIEPLSLEGSHPLDVVKAKVVWIGRYLEGAG